MECKLLFMGAVLGGMASQIPGDYLVDARAYHPSVALIWGGCGLQGGFVMLRRIGCRILPSLLGALIFASTAAAHMLTLSGPASIGSGPELKAGTYRVEVAQSKEYSAAVRFFRGNSLAAEVPAKLAKETSKCRSTEIHSEVMDGRQVITKIRLEGSNQTLVFSPDSTKAD